MANVNMTGGLRPALGLRLLYLVSHIGLGHTTRALVVANEIRRLVSGAIVEWCSSEPASSYLARLGERLVECCKSMESMSSLVERGGGVFSFRWMLEAAKTIASNHELIKECVDWGRYEYLIADEFWEVLLPEDVERGRMVFVTDFLAKPYKARDALSSLVFNRLFKRRLPEFRKVVYANTRGSMPRFRWFWVVGERVSDWAARVGVLPVGRMPGFDPRRLPVDKTRVRELLGLEVDKKIIVVLVGGTSTLNKGFLDLVEKAYNLVRERVGGVRLVVVKGPRTDWSPKSPGVVTKGLEPEAWMYIAAGDLVVSRAGRTTVAEIELLGTPAILSPIPNHFEQEMVAREAESDNIRVLSQNSRPELMALEMLRLIRRNPKPKNPRLYMGSILLARLIAGGLENPPGLPPGG